MRFAALLVALTLAPSVRASDDFFEKKIRPVLAEHCFKCHSADAAQNKKLKGNLYLDTRDGVRTGGDSGSALVPGKPAESLLLKTLRYDGDVKMPPAGKLPDTVVADFEKWIATGAADPRVGASGGRKPPVGMSIEAGRNFWAYIPVQQPNVPAVKANDWPLTDLDRFILAKLETKGLAPAPDADKPTLLRRVYFALIGLPPTPEEVDAFIADKSPDAYEKVVDRLLASPQFGERWGRHWLDVARYAESVTLRGFILKEAWRYRDYVIDSFNNDVPFDRFLREQIAGDLLPASTPADRRRQLIATTYLALGNTNLEEQDKKQLRMDVVDEQLDVIAKGLLAQTVTCARCHDHKFDPIPTKDYYALAGILRNAKAMEHANVSKWIEVPLPAEPAEEAALKRHETQVAQLQAKIKALKGAGATSAKGVLAVKDIPGIVIDDDQAKKVGEWQHSVHNGTYIGTGYIHDQDKAKGEKTLTFQPETIAAGRYEVRLAYTHGTNRSTAVPVTVMSADGEKDATIDMTKLPPIDGRFVSLGEFRFEKNGLAYVIVSNAGTKGHVVADAVVFLSKDQVSPVREPRETSELAKLEGELKRLQDTGPKRQMAMTVLEEGKIEDTRVHIRGSVHSLGEAAPRGFLSVLPHPAPSMPRTQSGRKELADWIAAKDNPLTARVFANRAWHWLLGSGIVRTVDNFGTTGELPSHPELLDHLATKFAEGWSVKKLVRAIVLSRTFRLANGLPTADVENQLFGRANRRRLEAEEIRDTMLFVSGKLNLERGGPTYPASLAADYGFKPTDTRRSVYSPVFRNALPELFEVFDFADTSVVTGKRNASTVAPQALFLTNHPFPAQQAKFAAERLLKESADEDTRLTRAYRRTLGRSPTNGERSIAKKFLVGKDEKVAWAALVQSLCATAEFRFVN